MKFEEIFNEAGLYVHDGFNIGVCFKIDDHGQIAIVIYKHKDDVSPSKSINIPISKSTFHRDFKKVLTRQDLFKPISGVV